MTDTPKTPSAASTLGAMWLFTLMRFGVFGVIFVLLLLGRVPLFWAGVVALVLSIPISFVLLNRQRQKLVDNLAARMTAHQARSATLDEQLSGGETSDDD